MNNNKIYLTEPLTNRKLKPKITKNVYFSVSPKDRKISYLIVYCDLVYLGIMALRPRLQGSDQGIHGGAGYQGSNYSPPFFQSHPDNLK